MSVPGCSGVGEEPNFLDWVKRKVGRGWNILVEKGGLGFEIMTALFFRAVSWISPTAADKLEGLWGHLQGIYLRMKASWKEDQFQSEIEGLKKKTEELTNKILGFHPAEEQLIFERDQARDEAANLRKTFHEIRLERVALDATLEELREESQDLREGSARADERAGELGSQVAILEKEKANLASQANAAIHEMEALKIVSTREDSYKKINALLEKLSQKTCSLVAAPSKEEQGMIREACEDLLPVYAENREDFHQLLEESISKMPQGKETGYLEGILRISRAETKHLQKISGTLQLIDELRLNLQGNLI